MTILSSGRKQLAVTRNIMSKVLAIIMDIVIIIESQSLFTIKRSDVTCKCMGYIPNFMLPNLASGEPYLITSYQDMNG